MEWPMGGNHRRGDFERPAPANLSLTARPVPSLQRRAPSQPQPGPCSTRTLFCTASHFPLMPATLGDEAGPSVGSISVCLVFQTYPNVFIARKPSQNRQIKIKNLFEVLDLGEIIP